MTDKELLRSRFSKASYCYDDNAVVQKHMVERLLFLLQLHGQTLGNRIFEVGCGTGFLTKEILKYYSPEEYFSNDICDYAIEHANVKFIPGDAEKIEYPKDLSAVVSSSCVQWFENIVSFFDKVYIALQNGGILLFSTFGEKNFTQIRTITQQSLSYYSTMEIKEMLSEKFEIVCIEEEINDIYFSSPKDILLHFRHTGVNSLQNKRWTKNDYIQFCDSYTQLYGSTKRFPLTYNPIYVLAKKIEYER